MSVSQAGLLSLGDTSRPVYSGVGQKPLISQDEMIARIQSCLNELTRVHSSQGQTRIQFGAQPTDSHPLLSRQHILRAITTSLSDVAVDHSQLQQLQFPGLELSEGKAIAQTLSDLLDAREFSGLPPLGKPTARMKATTPTQIIDSFQNLYSQGYREEAMQYVQSLQRSFIWSPQYMGSSNAIAFYCLQQGEVQHAIAVSDGIRPREKVDNMKHLVLERFFNANGLYATAEEIKNVDILVQYARSIKGKDWKNYYLLLCARHLIHRESFDKAFAILSSFENKSPEDQFSKLFQMSMDCDKAHAFAGSLDPSWSEKFIQVCQSFAPSTQESESSATSLRVGMKRLALTSPEESKRTRTS